MRYKKMILISILLLIILALLYMNLFNIAIGILKLEFTGERIIKISSDPIKYILTMKNGEESLIELLTKDNWDCETRYGADFIFKSKYNNGTLHGFRTTILNKYIVFEVTIEKTDKK